MTHKIKALIEVYEVERDSATRRFQEAEDFTEHKMAEERAAIFTRVIADLRKIAEGEG